MKILLVTEDLPVSKLGGAGKHAVLLGNALIEAGHEVELLGCLRQTGVDTNNDFQGKLHATIDMSHIGLKEVALGIFNPFRRLLIAWRIWTAIKQLPYQKFDVIHYHGHMAELGMLVPKYINYVHTLHDQGSECLTMIRFKNGEPCKAASALVCAGCATKSKPNLLQKWISASAVKLHRYLARKSFTRHKAIFVSDFLQQRFKSIVKKSNEINSSAIHNFTDVEAMRRLFGNNPALNTTNVRPIILLVGRVDQTKGQEAFLDALPNSVFAKMEIQIVGDGRDLDKLQEKYVTRGVKFLGFRTQEEVYKLTNQANACVMTSICEEAFGNTTLEAIVLGKPVLALNHGATPELMRYSIFPNQLQLFEDMYTLARALSVMDFPDITYSLNLQSDVRTRIPEILDVYAHDKKGKM